MKRENFLKYQFLNIRRYRLFYIYCIIIYFLVPIFGTDVNLYMLNNSDYIYRFNFQQIIVVYSNVFLTFVVLNEDIFKLFERYLYLYVKNIKKYLHSAFILLCLTNILLFIIGESLSLIINYIYYGTIPIKLIIVHLLVVSLEIISSVFLSMSLILILKNRVLSLTIYLIILTILMISNNIYISLPLPMSLVEDYYDTCSISLWIGRMILLGISAAIFNIATKVFIVGINK